MADMCVYEDIEDSLIYLNKSVDLSGVLCLDCETAKASVSVEVCPYNWDVNEKVQIIIVCEDCYSNRAADI